MTFFKRLIILALVSLISSQPTLAQSPIIWGAGKSAQMLNAGPLLNKSGREILPPSTYIKNSSGAGSTTGWAESGSGTLDRTTTAANLPRENTTGTALSFASSADEDYAYYRFILDDTDTAKKIGAQLAYISASANFRVEIWETDQSDYSSQTQVAVSTDDSSGDSYLPATTMVYPWSFDTTTDAYVELRIIHNGTNSDTIYFSDVVVSPDKVAVPGAALGPATTWTPTVGGVTGGSYTATGTYWRMGDRLRGRASVVWSSIFTGGSSPTISLPSGLTIDTSAIPGSAEGDATPLGRAWILDNSPGVKYDAEVVYSSTSAMLIRSFSSDGYTQAGITTTAPFTWANNDEIQLEFEVPIAEWAGSGTVSVDASSGCTYLYSTDTATAAGDSDASPDYAYGPGGANFVAIDSTTDNSVTTKFVYALREIQSTDIVQIETNRGSNNSWIPVSQTNLAYGRQSNRIYGMRLNSSPSDTRQLQVIFGNAGTQSGASYATSGTAWSNVTSQKWRVAHCYGLNARGFARASQNSLGLVKAGQVPGTNTNDDAEDGNVGEYESDSGTGVNIPTATNTEVAGSIVLTSGDWIVSGALMLTPAATTTVSSILYAISDDATGLPGATARAKPNACEYENAWYYGGATTAGNLIGFAIPSYRCSVASGSTKTLYLVARATIGTSTMTADGSLWARRIR